MCECMCRLVYYPIYTHILYIYIYRINVWVYAQTAAIELMCECMCRLVYYPMYTHIYMHVCMCVYVCVYICMYVCVCIYRIIYYMYMYIYICICIYIYIELMCECMRRLPPRTTLPTLSSTARWRPSWRRRRAALCTRAWCERSRYALYYIHSHIRTHFIGHFCHFARSLLLFRWSRCALYYIHSHIRTH